MMYASKTPRDLNRDPKPYYNIESHGRYTEAPAGTDYYFRYDPRPEFDAVQHNEPNPELTYYRTYEAARGREALLDFLDWLYLVHEHAPNAHVVHARRVLTRLANLKEES